MLLIFIKKNSSSYFGYNHYYFENGKKQFVLHRSTYGDKTSIIFVSISFLILMVISLTWLIVYYVQRFRLVQSPDVLKVSTLKTHGQLITYSSNSSYLYASINLGLLSNQYTCRPMLY